MPAEEIGGVQRYADSGMCRECSDLETFGLKPLEHRADVRRSNGMNFSTGRRVLANAPLKVAFCIDRTDGREPRGALSIR